MIFSSLHLDTVTRKNLFLVSIRFRSHFDWALCSACNQSSDRLLHYNCGMSDAYVKNSLQVGNEAFWKECRETHQIFGMGNEEIISCSLTGLYLEQNSSSDAVHYQYSCMKQLELLRVNAEFSAFRSKSMRLKWLEDTRADCLFKISQIAKITTIRFQKGHDQCTPT